MNSYSINEHNQLVGGRNEIVKEEDKLLEEDESEDEIDWTDV